MQLGNGAKACRLIGTLVAIGLPGCATDTKVGIPLPEYPRPDFRRDAWLNLNGQWDFSLDSLEVGETEGWYKEGASFDKHITVPFSWAAPLSGVGVDDVHIAWYARDIKIPNNKDWSDKRVFIIIGVCDFGTKLWLNGDYVGEHEGGYVPFEFNLTDFLDLPGENRMRKANTATLFCLMGQTTMWKSQAMTPFNSAKRV